jgi:hypothetical protein
MMAMRHVTQAPYIAAVWDIADLLADGQKSVAELAQATATHLPSLHRVLRVLSAAGIFSDHRNARYRLTPRGKPLCSEAADSVRAVCILWCGESNLEALLVDCVRGGKTAIELISGGQNWPEYYQQNSDRATVFNAAMTDLSNAHYTGVLGAYNFGSICRLVDVGGGHGRLISMILKE